MGRRHGHIVQPKIQGPVLVICVFGLEKLPPDAAVKEKENDDADGDGYPEQLLVWAQPYLGHKDYAAARATVRLPLPALVGFSQALLLLPDEQVLDAADRSTTVATSLAVGVPWLPKMVLWDK